MRKDDARFLTLELIHRTAAGERHAGRSLVDALRPIVHVVVARMFLRVRGKRGHRLRQEIDDLTQDVLIVLISDGCRKLTAWDPARGRNLPSFVSFIAQREVITILRKQQPDELPSSPDHIVAVADSASGPEQRALSKELVEKIYERAQARLTTTLGKAMFGWLFVDGREVQEVSELADMSEDAVYAWRKRIGDLLKAVAKEVVSDSSS